MFCNRPLRDINGDDLNKSTTNKYTTAKQYTTTSTSKRFGLTSREYKQRSLQTMCPVLRGVYLLVGLLLMVTESIDAFAIHAQDNQGENLTITLHPSNVSNLLLDQSVDVHMTYNYSGRYNIGLRLISNDKSIAETDEQTYEIRPRNDAGQYFSLRRENRDFLNQTIRINGMFLGRTYLEFFTNVSLFNATTNGRSPRQRAADSQEWFHMPGAKYPIVVTRKDGPLNHMFTGVIVILVVLANVAMGCKVDLKVVKQTMKRPIAPCIGLFSQFVIMPMLGFVVSQMFDFEPIVAFALLATGCAPGGGASNTYTYLVGGNVSLSVTMTLISTLASLGMVPLWLFTLGSLYLYRDSTFHIPYQNILIGLVGLVIPVLIGLLIQRKRPSWIRNILRAILPLMIILIVLILSVGVYANLYIFRLFQPKVIAAGALLPNVGFLLGGLLAIVFMQPWADVKTIAIETGLQNTGVPIILLLSMPKPESDLAIIAPIAAALFTPIIIWVFITARMIRNRFCRNRKMDGDVQPTKCQHTNAEHDAFAENIPCRRTEKIPPPCPMNYRSETQNMLPEKDVGIPIANGFGDSIKDADEKVKEADEKATVSKV